MQCSQCAAELVGDSKFCTSCGAAVSAAASPPARAVDPFAMTAKPEHSAAIAAKVPSSRPSSRQLEPGSSPQPSSRVSPLASSSIELASAVRELVVDEAMAHPAQGGTVQMQQRPMVVGTGGSPTPAPVKTPSVLPPSVGLGGAALGPGTAVWVRWANGQKYPGTVWQTHGTQVLVSFQDGQRHWVEASFCERS